MSKENNLTDFLTDIADAIREKKGTTDLINPQDFSEEIRKIESGSTEVEEKDINFYDYDGTLLFSYTIPEAQALTELPTPKGHSGLIFDGWNWDYEEVIALDYPMNIGAMYKTDDGKTRLYLKVDEPTSISLSFQNLGTATVDFGDGEVVETSETKPVLPHTYAVGEYMIRIDSTNSYTLEFSVNSGNILGKCAAKSSGLLQRVEVGDRGKVGATAFKACYNMSTITYQKKGLGNSAGWTETYYGSGLIHLNLPKGSSIFVNGVANTSRLRIICLPSNPLYITSGCISNSSVERFLVPDGFSLNSTVDGSGLRKFRCPSAMTSLPNNMFNRCQYLEEVELHSDISSFPNNCFNECYCLRKFNMPVGLETIMEKAFYNCRSLRVMPPFPSTLNSIGTNAFWYIPAVVFDFSACSQIPTLVNTNAFEYTSGIIVVPDNLYNEWIAATNWSTYADRIIKASEYQSNNE